MKKAVETAIKMETDAIAFYKEAAKNTKHVFGREMFKGFVKDETRHLKMLKNIFNGLGIEADFHRPKEAVQTVFSKLKNKMMRRVKALDNEMPLTSKKQAMIFIKRLRLKQPQKTRKNSLNALLLKKTTIILY